MLTTPFVIFFIQLQYVFQEEMVTPIIANGQILQEILSRHSPETVLVYSEHDIEDFSVNSPQIVTNGANVLELNSVYNADVFSVVFLSNLTMLVMLSRFLCSNMFSKVLVIKEIIMENNLIFQQCAGHNLFNVALIEDNGEITTYTPFKEPLEISEVTSSRVFETNDFRNFHGMQSTLGGKLFGYVRAFEKCMQSVQNFIEDFRDFYNVTLVISDSMSQDVTYSMEYTEEQLDQGKLQYFQFQNLIVIVPANIHVNRHLYFLYPFNWKIWVVLAVGIIYKSVIVSVAVGLISGHFDFSKACLQCLKLLLWQDSMIVRKHNIINLIYILLTVEGFVLVNLYSMYLGSFLITNVKQTSYEIAFTSLSEKALREMFEDGNQIRLKEMSVFEYAFNLLSMNPKYGYIVDFLSWTNNDVLQANFRKLKTETRKPIPLAGLMKKNYFLEHALNDFFLTEYSYGLFQKKMQNCARMELGTRALEGPDNQHFILKDFVLVIDLALFGLGLASIICLCEVIYGKIINRN